MSSAVVIIASVIGFASGAVTMWSLLYSPRYEKKEERRRYRNWKDNLIYEVLMDDVVNTTTCEHYVVFRSCFGKRITFCQKQNDFYGKVINFQKEEVDRYTLIN